MIADLSKAIAQLSDPKLRNAIILSVIASLILIAAFGFLAWLLVGALSNFGWDWVNELVAWLGAIAVVVIAPIFFPSAANVISGLFLDQVADAVDARHYPDMGPGRSTGVAEAIAGSLRLLLIAVVLNLLALPIYLLLPGINLVLFYGLNGYLLGREFFEAVAQRRLDAKEARTLRKRNRIRSLSAGVVIAFLATIPIVNLTVPVLATAFMVHVVRRLLPGGNPA